MCIELLANFNLDSYTFMLYSQLFNSNYVTGKVES